MKKVIRDGKVAVLYSPGYGAGWYTWHNIQELIYDPEVVKMVEDGVYYDEISIYCERVYGKHCYIGADDLTIEWIPVGYMFEIREYDGNETIILDSEKNYMKA